MKNAMLIMKKELARVFKDKSMIISLFILPIIIMVGMYSLIGTFAKSMESDIEEHRGIVRMQNVPEDAKQIMASSGYDKVVDLEYIKSDAPEETISAIKEQILSGDIDLFVVFDSNFEAAFTSYEKNGDNIPNITVYANTAENYSSQARAVFSGMVLEPYRTYLQSVRFGNLDLLTVFEETEIAIVNEDKANGQFISMMLPYLIIMMLFASAMSLCVDAVAGEKERGTLASLLLSPIKRSELAFGKIAGLSILASISAIIYAISSIFSMGGLSNSLLELEGAEGGSINFSVTQLLSMAVIMILLVYTFVAIVSFFSIIAKDTKQASSFISPLYIVVIVLGVITMFTGSKTPADIMYLIPVYGSALAIQNITINALTGIQLLYACLGSLILAILATFGIKKAFDSEKIMFNA